MTKRWSTASLPPSIYDHDSRVAKNTAQKNHWISITFAGRLSLTCTWSMVDR